MTLNKTKAFNIFYWSTASLAFIVFFCWALYSKCKTSMYFGKAISVYRVSAGRYNDNTNAHVIFYSDSLKRNIDIVVTNQCAANIKKGETVCFKLSFDDINN